MQQMEIIYNTKQHTLFIKNNEQNISQYNYHVKTILFSKFSFTLF